MKDIRKLQGLVRTIEHEGPTTENLKRTVLALIDEIIWLSRELDTVSTQARRADRNARNMGMIVRR
jgi:hypothetical protein